MSTFTLAISCLTTSNLPWFMDLTFQVPMQYCSLKHQTLLLSPVPPTTGYCFCFGSIPSFFLELFLHWSPVAYWAPSDLGSSSFSILSFCLFILFMGFSRHEYWSGLPFTSTVDHIISDLTTITHPSWVAPQGMAYFHWVRQGWVRSTLRSLESTRSPNAVSVRAVNPRHQEIMFNMDITELEGHLLVCIILVHICSGPRRNAPAVMDHAEVWAWGGTPCPRSGVVTERSYPSLKVRSSSCALLEQP